jgi:hypothetical protein
VGAVGAILGLLIQRFAAGFAGFLAGWYLTLTLLNTFHWSIGEWTPALPILGGVIGALFIAVNLDWSLIILSSLAGSTMVMQGIRMPADFRYALLGALFLLGVLIQAILLSQENEKR